MTTATANRDTILRKINECEIRLVELRATLPTAIMSFFRFRCKPEKHVWVYALTRQEAEQKLRDRMNTNYGSEWQIASNVVDQYNDPVIAAINTPGSLLRALSEADARKFIADWRDDQKGRTVDVDRPKNLPKSQLEQDIEDYELFLRRKDAS